MNDNTIAYMQGWEASGIDMPRDRNPYEVDSPEWMAWDMGWANGVEEDEDNAASEEYDELLRRISELEPEEKQEIVYMINEGLL